jgi:hypothetical protein
MVVGENKTFNVFHILGLFVGITSGKCPVKDLKC